MPLIASWKCTGIVNMLAEEATEVAASYDRIVHR